MKTVPIELFFLFPTTPIEPPPVGIAPSLF
jgi:hypothetical protein